MKLSAAALVRYAEALDLACAEYDSAIRMALTELHSLDATTFTFPEPRSTINSAIATLEKAVHMPNRAIEFMGARRP